MKVFIFYSYSCHSVIVVDYFSSSEGVVFFFLNIHIKLSKLGIELTIDLKLWIFFFRIQIGIFIITFD